MEKIICKGFKAAGIAAGIKKDKVQKDLGLIFSEVPANAAGVFTTNKVQAAPVLLDKERIKSGSGQALIVNSGNANCCNGNQGMADAIAMSGFVSTGLNIAEESIFVASTGVIGNPMPMEKIKNAVPNLIQALSPDGFSDLAEAIMTTDTVPKIVVRQGELDGKDFTLIGVAKGAGMICPNMATMLCFVCTDIGASSDILGTALTSATQKSFNCITIDGDTSTNDTILLMANGMSGAVIKNDSHKGIFQSMLDDLLITLSKIIVKDGEGATKLVEIVVKGAESDRDARAVANTIANSNLVKTAFFGEDANWGRILAAVGRSGVPIEPDKVDIFFDNVKMVQNGIGCGNAAEAEATKVLKMPEFKVSVDLKMGNGTATVFTCDFSVDYVRINADYRS